MVCHELASRRGRLECKAVALCLVHHRRKAKYDAPYKHAGVFEGAVNHVRSVERAAHSGRLICACVGKSSRGRRYTGNGYRSILCSEHRFLCFSGYVFDSDAYSASGDELQIFCQHAFCIKTALGIFELQVHIHGVTDRSDIRV